MYYEFEDISRLLLKGLFAEVDPQSYLTGMYMAFLDKLLTTFELTAEIHHSSVYTEGPQRLVAYVLTFFQDNCKVLEDLLSVSM
jgi:hypothetical protein